MGIPLAVAASVRTPGLALAINLLAAASSPGTAALRALVIAEKSSAGTITADTEIKIAIGGADDAKTYLGTGTPGHLACKALFTEYGLALVDLVAPAVPGGVVATQTVVFDDAVGGGGSGVTVAHTVTLEIMGREATISWAAGETDIQGATKLVAAVNALGDDLPLTAANGGGTLATVTLTFRFAGTIGNDVKLYLTDKDGTGGTVTLTGATLASGTLEPTLTTVLTLVSGREYDLILPCVSNTDAGAASATSGPGRLKTHVNTYGSGFSAHLQQVVVGVTGSISVVKTGTAQHNFGPMEYVFCQEGRSLGCEWGGAEVGARLREEVSDPNVNRINTTYRALLYGARDLVADALTDPELEDLLQSGVTGITYTSSNEPRVSRPITTYFKDASANPDGRLLDIGRVSGIYAIAKDLRVALPQEFPNTKLSADLDVGDDDLPEGVTQVHEVKAFVVTRLRFWQKRGVARKDELDKAIKPVSEGGLGTLIVRVNPSDPSQCDLVVPLAIVPPLAKFSMVVQKVA